MLSGIKGALGATLEVTVGFGVWVPTCNSPSRTVNDTFLSSPLVFALGAIPQEIF